MSEHDERAATMATSDWLTEGFETHSPHRRAVID
jgi:hypothetical protein